MHVGNIYNTDKLQLQDNFNIVNIAVATTTLPATKGSLTLLSTCLGHRSTAPPPSRRHKGSRRGRRPAIWPSAE